MNPDPQALDTCDTHDMGGEQKHDIGVECVLKEEAKKFAVHASWMIEEAEKNITHMPHGLEDALKDCTFVVATTGEPREHTFSHAERTERGHKERGRERESGGAVRKRSAGIIKRRTKVCERLRVYSNRWTPRRDDKEISLHRRSRA